jgi:hypothetical protein
MYIYVNHVEFPVVCIVNTVVYRKTTYESASVLNYTFSVIVSNNLVIHFNVLQRRIN